MSPLRWIALGAVLVATSAACGFPTFSFSTSSGGASTGGASSISSSSSSTGGGVGGFGPKPCHALQDAVDCGANERCTVVDVNQGTLGCVPLAADVKAPRARCSNDDACPVGTFCDRRTAVCMPLCNGAASCAGRCVPAETENKVTIPGVTVCTAHCNPTNPSACGLGAMCGYDPMALDFDCFFFAGKGPGEVCEFINDCPPTHVCVGTCEKWCHPADAFGEECQGYCSPFANATFIYDMVEYGYCPPPP